jgi:hypothetical protein
MNCPKCGKQMLHDSAFETNINKQNLCVNKNCERDYQERLDKVLSKFSEYDKVYLYDGLYLKGQFIINYYKKCKKFFIDNLNISLNTVESLLKDLEDLDNE